MKKTFFDDLELVVFEDVYEPDEDSFLLARHVRPLPGSKVLDMGCGCGIISIVAALKGAKVLSVDINKSALRNTELNAIKHKVKSKIKVLSSDLFGNVNGVFDYIYFNPPYVPRDENDEILGRRHPVLSKSWDGGEKGREVIARFIKEVGKYMHEKTRTLMVASSKNDFQWLISFAGKQGLNCRIIDEKHLFFEALGLFELRKA